VRQQAPSTPAAHNVEDGIDDLAQGVQSRASGGVGGREVGIYVGPFGIGEVGLVCSSHARYSTELPSQDTFSDSFFTQFSEVRADKQRLSNNKDSPSGGCTQRV
jgi:hypothetical protein